MLIYIRENTVIKLVSSKNGTWLINVYISHANFADLPLDIHTWTGYDYIEMSSFFCILILGIGIGGTIDVSIPCSARQESA